MITRREKIALYLKEYTEKAIDKNGIDLQGITASDITDHFKMDRTTSSRELNALYNDGTAMKFLGRPTHYLHYQTVLSIVTSHVPSTIPAGLSLKDFLNQEHSLSPSAGAPSGTDDISLKFSPYDYSFQHAAELSEAAIRYPRPELHCLFVLPDSLPGNNFASAMLSFGQQIGRFATGSKLHTYECHFVLKNISAYHISLQLFGAAATPTSSAKKGLIEKANESILFLNNIQYMPPSIEERFQALLMRNTFSRYGEDNFVRRNNTLIVASCSKEAYDNNESPIFPYFPMKIFFPAMRDWTVEDLFHYICILFQKQAQILDTEIKLGKDILYYLLCAICSGSSVSIQAQIKQLCAIAYAKNIQKNKAYLEIYPEYLPAPLFSFAAKAVRSSEFSIFLNEHFQTHIYISGDSLPFIFPAPKPVIPVSAADSAVIPPVSNYLNMNLETYLDDIWHMRLPRHTSPTVYSAVLYNTLEQDSHFPHLEENSLLLSWSAQLLDSFLENIRKNKDKLPFDSSYFKKTIPDFILETAKCFTEQLNLSFSANQKNLFVLFSAAVLHTVYQWCRETNILVAVFYKDAAICRSTATYLQAGYHIPVVPLYSPGSWDSDNFHAQIAALLKDQTPCCQLLIFLEEMPLTELDAYISRIFQIPTKCFSNVSLSFMAETLQKITRFHYSLHMLADEAAVKTLPKNTVVIPDVSALVLQAINRLLEPSLNFIDIYKVLPLMRDSLKEIADSLNCPLTDELSIKYYFHCAHMIERLIRKEPLHYPGIKAFSNNHPNEFHVIEFSLLSISQYYGFKIPAAETAYLIEIFL